MTIIQGNAAHLALSDGTIQTCVTSPPYLSQRQYHTPPQVWGDGWRGELGLEPTPELYIAHLVQVFREVRRVLRDDGTLWVNIGDSYASRGGAATVQTLSPIDGAGNTVGNALSRKAPDGFKPKDLIGIPWMLAFALRADGWYLRSEIVWAKGLSFLPDYAGSCMPESVTDRPTKAHETVFLLSKSARYYYDQEAVREQVSQTEGAKRQERWRATLREQNDTRLDHGYQVGNGHRAFGASNPSGRNLRSVWAISPEPSKLSHYAMMPTRLARTCILAGTSARGACPKCGAPWERVVEVNRSNYTSRQDRQTATGGAITGGVGKNFPDTTTTTTGWRPTCECFGHFEYVYDPPAQVTRDYDSDPLDDWEEDDDSESGPVEPTPKRYVYVPEGEQPDPVPCLVLDPFSGAGTTGKVAVELGRDYVGVELNPDYVAMHDERMTTTRGLGL